MERHLIRLATRLGGHFDYSQPEAYEPDVREIAFVLSNMSRFGGHVRAYSLAQHCVIASQQVPRELAREALLHDAHKAYLGEPSAPLKRLLPDYQALERRVCAAMRIRLELPQEASPEVLHIRASLSLAEALHFGIPARDFPRDVVPLDVRIEPQAADVAERAFLQRYRQLAAATPGARRPQPEPGRCPLPSLRLETARG